MNNPLDGSSIDPCIAFWVLRKGWYISPPYGEWNFWHIIEGSGIVPFNLDQLILEYEISPLSQDEIAVRHRKSHWASTNNVDTKEKNPQ